jgi:hypothetical protein
MPEEWRDIALAVPTVVKVNVALAPALVTGTGFVPPMEQVGAGLTTGETLHESLTLPA